METFMVGWVFGNDQWLYPVFAKLGMQCRLLMNTHVVPLVCSVCVVSRGSESWVKEKFTQENVKYTADTI